MSIAPRLRSICLLVVVLAGGAYVFCPGILFYGYDSWRLARFTNRLRNSDRVVVACGSGTAEAGTDDTRKVIRAIASAASVRPPLFTTIPAMWDTRATFLSGTNVLGYIDLCGNGFLVQGSGAPFEDGNAVLWSLLGPAAHASGQAK